jgi:hypothetical protein
VLSAALRIYRSVPLGGAAVWAPVAIFLAVYFVLPPNEPLFNPDSDSYLNFTAIRTGGYPFFLAFLKPLIRDPSDYAAAQLVLYALAVMALGWQLRATGRSALFCFVVEGALLGNWLVNRHHFALASESVFLSTSALFLAAALGHLRTGSLASLAAAAGFAAFAAAVRPTGLVLVAAFPVVLIAAPALSRPMRLRLLAAVAPLVIVFAAESLYYHAHHPGPRTSLLPTQILGKAGMVEVADPNALINDAPISSKPLQTALEFQLRPVRKLISDAPGVSGRCRLAANYEMFVEYQFAPAERAELVAASGEEGLTKAAFVRLRHGLPDYLCLTADSLFCMWTVWAAENEEKSAFAAYLDGQRPLPFEDAVSVVLATSQSLPFASGVRAGMLGVAGLLALASVCLLAALCRCRGASLELAMSGLCGMIVHGGLLLSALAGAGIPRYTLGLWVPLVVGIAFSVQWVLGLIRSAGLTVHAMNARVAPRSE